MKIKESIITTKNGDFLESYYNVELDKATKATNVSNKS